MSEHQIWISYSLTDLTTYELPGKRDYAIYTVPNTLCRRHVEPTFSALETAANFFGFVPVRVGKSSGSTIESYFKQRKSNPQSKYNLDLENPDLIIIASEREITVKLSPAFTADKSELTCFNYASNLLNKVAGSLASADPKIM